MHTPRRLLAAILAAGLWTSAHAADAPPAAPYPLDTCVVSGEKLGSMGDPYVVEHNGVKVQLCCKGCLKKFLKNPDAYLAKLAAARAAQEKSKAAQPSGPAP